MIRNDGEYQGALEQLRQNDECVEAQRAEWEQAGYAASEVARGLEPLLSFRAGLSEEIAWYEKVKRREFPPLSRLSDLGRLLIALRIANALSQRELAGRLGVSEAQVSRDERNEYHGITLDRAQRILDALHERLVAHVEEPPMRLAT